MDFEFQTDPVEEQAEVRISNFKLIQSRSNKETNAVQCTRLNTETRRNLQSILNKKYFTRCLELLVEPFYCTQSSGGHFADWLLHSLKDEAMRDLQSILNKIHPAFCGLTTPINKRETT